MRDLLAKCIHVENSHFLSNSIQQRIKQIEGALNRFIISNPTLTKLSIVDCGIHSIKVFRWIGRNLQYLQELEFSQNFLRKNTTKIPESDPTLSPIEVS